MHSHGAPSEQPGEDYPSPALLAAASDLSRQRLAFAIPAILVSFGGFVVITILTGFTDVLEVTVIGPITLLVLLLALGFPLVGVCAYLYSRQAARWDVMTTEALARARDVEAQQTAAAPERTARGNGVVA